MIGKPKPFAIEKFQDIISLISKSGGTATTYDYVGISQKPINGFIAQEIKPNISDADVLIHRHDRKDESKHGYPFNVDRYFITSSGGTASITHLPKKFSGHWQKMLPGHVIKQIGTSYLINKLVSNNSSFVAAIKRICEDFSKTNEIRGEPKLNGINVLWKIECNETVNIFNNLNYRKYTQDKEDVI